MTIDIINNKLDKINEFLERKTVKLEKSNKKKAGKTITFHLFPRNLVFFTFCILWGMGVIISKGFWATFAAFFIPFIGPATAVFWLIEKFTGVWV